MSDHVEQIIKGYIDLFGDESSTANPTAPNLTAADHTQTALGQTTDLESDSADGYRTTAARTIALADILSGLDATTVQLIMDNARDNEAVREQLKTWLTEYRSNKAALMSFLDTPTGQAAMSSLASNTITAATQATQQSSNRNTDRAGLTATVGDQYTAQTPAAAFTQQAAPTPSTSGTHRHSNSGGTPRTARPATPSPSGSGRSASPASLFAPTGSSGGNRQSFAAPNPGMQVASSPGPSFAPASAASYSPGASGGGNPAPAPNNPDYSWVRADPGSRSEVSTTQGAAAVNAALSKLGVPYVWGGESMAEGGFDCSGLMQYAVAQATNGAVILPRTTFDMIHAGVAVSADQLQPGDLIFPNEGHVQMYIGDGKVVEAQQTGTNIMISPLGDFIAARRVL